eukprot:CAMPEP_0170107832 /NCGR_PEP_ID=MMETSP0020_2-20130122/6212_1 /TAXON_ID=98059 /ORGANISM="Dinobryon sp., Strain UTEXLB2267" /LENGTH=1044 /DNA_ID=CAMNT_0010332441 /DNA_START=252 /DNA_END=3386 /DNA_ORIENTATION=+
MSESMIMQPIAQSNGQIRVMMQRDFVSNDVQFVNFIAKQLTSKFGEKKYPSIEEFKQDVQAYLFKRQKQVKYPSDSRYDISNSTEASALHTNTTRIPYEYTYSSNTSSSNPHATTTPVVINNGTGGNYSSGRKHTLTKQTIIDSDLPDDRKSSNRIDYEKSEPIVRLLAQVRKVGMDILFPQSTHDKILACIFVAIKSSSTPAHRELIDMVMAVRDSGKISQLDHVSKTKVRGVLALLKHGELLITQGEEGEPVRLFLAHGITCFKDLRERHDAFLHKYIQEHHLFIPAILKSELVWQLEEETKTHRLIAVEGIVNRLTNFYKDYMQQTPLTDVSSQSDFLRSSRNSSPHDSNVLLENAARTNNSTPIHHNAKVENSNVFPHEFASLSSDFKKVNINDSSANMTPAEWLSSNHSNNGSSCNNTTMSSVSLVTNQMNRSSQMSPIPSELDSYNLGGSPPSMFNSIATPPSTVASTTIHIPFKIPYRMNVPHNQKPQFIQNRQPTAIKYPTMVDSSNGNKPFVYNSTPPTRNLVYPTQPPQPSLNGIYRYSPQAIGGVAASAAMHEWRASSPFDSKPSAISSTSELFTNNNQHHVVNGLNSSGSFSLTGKSLSSSIFLDNNDDTQNILSGSTPSLSNTSQSWFGGLYSKSRSNETSPTFDMLGPSIREDSNLMLNRDDDVIPSSCIDQLNRLTPSPEFQQPNLSQFSAINSESQSMKSTKGSAFGDNGSFSNFNLHSETVISSLKEHDHSLENNSNSFFSQNSSSVFQSSNDSNAGMPRLLCSPLQRLDSRTESLSSLRSTPLRPSFDTDNETASRLSANRSYSPYTSNSSSIINNSNNNHTYNSNPSVPSYENLNIFANQSQCNAGGGSSFMNIQGCAGFDSSTNLQHQPQQSAYLNSVTPPIPPLQIKPPHHPPPMQPQHQQLLHAQLQQLHQQQLLQQQQQLHHQSQQQYHSQYQQPYQLQQQQQQYLPLNSISPHWISLDNNKPKNQTLSSYIGGNNEPFVFENNAAHVTTLQSTDINYQGQLGSMLDDMNNVMQPPPHHFK